MRFRCSVWAEWALLSVCLMAGTGHAADLAPADLLDARISRYNQGVAQIKSGDTASGMATLDALSSEPADTDELRVLRDRTNLALGFAALAAQQPAQARTFLARVPLQAPESNQALLGFGWAALELNAPQSALVPWLTLIKRDPSDSAVLQARMAVPFAYQQLKAYAKALQYYTEALQAFERERISLDEEVEFVRSGRLLDALLSGWNMEALPEVPHAAHLNGLWPQAAFRQAFTTLRSMRRAGEQGEAQRAELQGMALAELTRQQADLSAYTLQARYAVAQLYDRAASSGKASSNNKEIPDAPKP